MPAENALPSLLGRIRACELCAHELEPRPVVRLATTSRVLIVGQAPGTKVHASGIPWDDASGDHLREWLDVDRETFDDVSRFGIVPMGFCYPGRAEGGDKPPPKRCAETWHAPLLESLDDEPLLLLVGQYAQKRYLGRDRKKTLTETVRSFREYLPRYFPLPHPSWRSRRWIQQNPFFEEDVLPALRAELDARRAG